MKELVLVGAIALVIQGCGYPAYTSAMRTNFEGDVPTVMYCYRLEEKMGEEFARHVHEMSLQGWRLAYVSEYTSTSKSKFAITYCVEGVGIRHLPVDQKDKATQ